MIDEACAADASSPHGDRQPLPDAHLYARSKVPWVALPESVPQFVALHDPKTLWPAASLERRKAALA